VSSETCVRRQAPRFAAAAVGLVAFTIGVPPDATAGPDFPIIVKAKSAQDHKPRRQASHRKYRRSKQPSTELSAAQCTLPNAGCTVPVPGTLQAYAVAAPVRRQGRGGGMTTSRNCLAPAARALLHRLEAQFGTVKIVSTCRRGATIAGTRQPSMHRYGKAIDFIAPPGRKADVVRWLRDNSPGVTMTYYRMSHIHTDVGPYHKVIYGAGAPRQAKRRQARQRLSARASTHLR